MKQIVDGWVKVLKDPTLPDALDGGYDAVVHLLGDVIDEWLQTAVPVYATAVEICAMSPPQIFDCDKERINVRDKVLDEILTRTQLRRLLEEVLRQWRAIPDSVRSAAKIAVEIAGDVASLYDDPTTDNFLRAAEENSELASKYLGPTLENIYYGLLPRSPVTKFMLEAFTVDSSQIQERLRKYGMQAIDELGSYVEAAVSKYLGSDAAKVAGWVIDVFTDPYGAGEDMVKAIGATVRGGASSVVDGIKSAGGVVSDVGGAVADAGGKVLDLVGL